MQVTLHLCGPLGDALRQQLERTLEILKDDNACVINAMINEGMDVPDTMIDMGLTYQPASGGNKLSANQDFYGMSDMLNRGTFSCGDAAAYEAAVMQVKYGIPTRIVVVPQGQTDFHALYVTSSGPVDPTENWLAYSNGRARLRSARRLAVEGLEPVEVGPTCQIVPGTNIVECTKIEGYDSSPCVDSRGRWRCPDSDLHGQPADVRQYRRRDGVRWALVGPDRTPVPVCGGGR